MPERPPLHSTHRILWHPHYGDMKHSNCYGSVVAITEAGPWLRIPGQPVLAITWEQWERMAGE